MSHSIDPDVAAGQAVYSPLVLSLYDAWVLGVSNHLLWRCPTSELRQLYDRNVSARHLDIGVGSGYYLDHAAWPVENPEITLMDLNPQSLATAARRISRYRPRRVEANVLVPFPEIGPFDSVAVCYLLHCLPGTLSSKAVVFDHILNVSAPGSRVFGATIVQGAAPRSRPAQRLMDLYNRKGIFSNTLDTADRLEKELSARFEEVEVSTKGCVALFECCTAA